MGRSEGAVPAASTRIWVLLWGCAALACAALLWGLLGTATVTVSGEGMLLRGSRLAVAEARASGMLLRTEVKPGDAIRKGQVLAVLATPELDAAAAGAAAVDAALRTVQERIWSEEDRAHKRAIEAWSARESALRQQVQKSEALLARQREQIELCESLARDGLVARADLLEASSAALEVERFLLEASQGLSRISVERAQQEAELLRSRSARQAEAARAAADLAVAAARRDFAAEVTAPSDGTVVQVVGHVGQVVHAGEALVVLTESGQGEQPLECVAFLPLGEGKRLEPGMEARVSPAPAPSERYGAIRGIVQSVEPIAATTDSMARLIHSPEVVQDLDDKYGALVACRISLVADPSAPSGVAWSSGSGWPGALTPGTPCEVEVLAERVAPIRLVMPWLRESARR